MIFKVLIIDDDYINRRLLISLLEKELYSVNVIETVDGQDALNTCREHNDIQLILLDVEMPRMDGSEFLKHYFEDDTLNRKVPIIAISSNDLRKREVIELGASSFLMKPISEERLLHSIVQASQMN